MIYLRHFQGDRAVKAEQAVKELPGAKAWEGGFLRGFCGFFYEFSMGFLVFYEFSVGFLIFFGVFYRFSMDFQRGNSH